MAVFVREGLTYKTRPDLGVFDEGRFESVFVEIIRGRGRRNDVVGVVYRPPGASPGEFSEVLTKMAQVLTKLRGVNGYIMGDFNVDLIKTGTQGPSGEFLGRFTSRVLLFCSVAGAVFLLGGWRWGCLAWGGGVDAGEVGCRGGGVRRETVSLWAS